jgi:hypothetical protein
MALAIKIINSVLILFALYMGVKQGWAMLSGKPEMTTMFGAWGIGNAGLAVIGVFTILGALLVLFPATFVWGNFITAAGILLIIAFHLLHKDLKGVAIELPFLLMSLLIIYLQHPLAKA